jgi:tRNA A-37 threonylcarbamoyl transferase component Bud32
MVRDVVCGRYELEELVGSGGMSSVYRAHDRVLERTVALKVLHRKLADDEEYVERFRREAQMVAGLLHHNIVTVIDRGEDDDRPFIVFEYVGGENLKELVQREGPLPVERALELGLQIASGLAFAHENGFIHRDVKPQNVLLNGNGEAKVTDFGIARSLDVKQGVTQTGAVVGTSEYIAPEQAQGQHVDERTDVYSLGILLYELLTGELPFSGENFVAVAMQHINQTPPRVSERRPDVPPRLDAAVAKALEKSPEHRFATMADFGRELEACFDELRAGNGGYPTMILQPPPRARRVRRRRRRVPVAAIAIVIGLAVAAAALVIAIGHETGGSGPSAKAGGAPVSLGGVTAYDPPPGDGNEHNSDAPKATDGNPQTFWETQDYHSPLAAMGKSGVGLVLSSAGGASVTLHHVTVTTDTPGFTAEIEAGGTASGPFHAVSSPKTVNTKTTFDVSGAKAPYFVVWITNLGSLSKAHVNEVTAD